MSNGTLSAAAIQYKVPKRRHPVLQFMVQQPLGAAGLAIIVLMCVCAAFAQWVAPYDPLAVDYGAMLAAPSAEHWMGTDSFGRDVLSRVIYGARTALAIGFIASFLGSTVGAIIGVASAYFGGRTDLIIQGIMDVLLSFPIIVLAIETDLPGHEVFYIASPDTIGGHPLVETVTTHYQAKDIELRPTAREDAAPISTAKAERLLGWKPTRTWRD